MEVGMKGNSLAMKLKEWGYINGRMGGSIKESGRRIKCMGKGKLHGRMEGNMKEIMLMIKSMDMGCLFGRMGGSMMGSGRGGNNMGKEFIRLHRRKKK